MPVLPSRGWRPKYARGHKANNNGLWVCTECGEDLEIYVIDHVAHLRHRRRKTPTGMKPIPDNERTHCSSCGRPFKPYELEPGTGRCIQCQP